MSYHPEKYWNNVAERISSRDEARLVAGDAGPFYQYKRKRFLELLRAISFSGKRVLELGPGPGGNLLEVLAGAPKELHGADISENMLLLASQALKGTGVQLQKITGGTLNYPDRYFDLSYTATVLQHNTDEKMLRPLVSELCRVTANEVYIFERIEKTVKGTALCLGRPVRYYENLFQAEGFYLQQSTFLNVQVSHVVCGVIRKLVNPSSRKEGEQETAAAVRLQGLVLPLTSLLDRLFPVKRELAMLAFRRK